MSPPAPTTTAPEAVKPAPEKEKVDKKTAKAAKEARRLAQKGANAAQAGPARVVPVKGGPAQGGGGAAIKSTNSSGTSLLTVVEAAPPRNDPLQLFLHLDLPSTSSSLSHSSKSSTANIHPSIIRLALQYAEFKIVGANARCIGMLDAFKDVITSYSPPPQQLLPRHLAGPHLGPQINHLIRARPLSVSMKTAIRYLKYEISLIGLDVSLDSAKAILLHKIDAFIRDRIILADKVIEQHAIPKIKDGETILTYARSSVVEGVLLEAKRQGKSFSVVVVDSRPLYEGKALLASLRSAAIPTTYVLLPSLALILPRVSLCILGTHALLSNGSMFSRAGTAMVAMMLKEKGVPVMCCCETYKFSENVMLDSIVGNEMASSISLLPDHTDCPPNLSPLSLLYDVSRPEDVTVVITEAGLIPVQSVPVLLRDFKPLMQGS